VLLEGTSCWSEFLVSETSGLSEMTDYQMPLDFHSADTPFPASHKWHQQALQVFHWIYAMIKI